MKKDKILYASCSEVVWRLNFKKTTSIQKQIVKSLLNEKDCSSKIETDTASYPNGCVEEMIDMINDIVEDGCSIDEITLDILDNIGGGGDSNFVLECFLIALDCCRGNITLEQALKKEDKLWSGGDDEDPDG